MDLVACQAFVTAVDHGSITAAADELGLSRPTVSRRLSALEEDLGLALLHRTTRQVRPTPAGQKLYDRVRPVLQALDAGVEELVAERDGIVGRLVVSVPLVLVDEAARLVLALTREHPGLQVDLHAENRLTDLRAGQVEVALRAGRLDDPELVQRRLVTRDVRAVASPAYLDHHGRPNHPDELAHHILLQGLHPDGRPRESWPLLDGGRVRVQGRFRTGDQRALREAALADGGIALLSEVGYADAVAGGRLEVVLPDHVGARLDLYVVLARRTLQPARVRAFVEAAVQHFR